MKTPNTIEQEIDRIRLEIYEETKDMTPAQRAEHTNKTAEAIALKYRLKIMERTGDKIGRTVYQP